MDIGYFHLLAPVDSAAVNTGVRGSVWDPAFSFSGCMFRRGITWAYSTSMLILRNLHTVSRSGCTHQQCPRVSTSPHPHQQLCFICGWNSLPNGCESESVLMRFELSTFSHWSILTLLPFPVWKLGMGLSPSQSLWFKSKPSLTSLQEVRGVIDFKLEGRPGEETAISMQGRVSEPT